MKLSMPFLILTGKFVSFQINPYWISNSGLWKVVLETFYERPGNPMKGVLVNTPRQCSRTQVYMWLQWLLCMTVALNWLTTIHILLIWHHQTISCSPTWKKHLAGKRYRTDDEVLSAGEDFFEDQMRASLSRESKCCNTDGRSVWTAGETMLKNKPHLVKSDHCIIVSLWTFQPTLEF